MGHRRLARQRAIQILYTVEMTGYDLTQAILGFCQLRDDLEQHPKPIEQFTYDLVHWFLENREKVDGDLKQALINWQFDRLSLVDRNLLRLAVSELLFCEDVPPRVTINEYIDLSKEFSDPESPQFINGVLDRVARNEQFDLTNTKLKIRYETGEKPDSD